MASLTAANAVSTPILCADDDDWAPLVTKSSDTKTPLVVAFGAGWCGPCKVLKPVFRALAKEWTAKDPGNAPIFVEVDVDEVIETSMELGIKTLPSYQVRLGKKLLRECKTATEAGLSEMVRWACTRATGDVGGTLPVLKKSGGGCCSGGSCGPKTAKESTGKEGGGCCSNGSCGTKKATVRDHGHGHGHAAAAASAAAAPASSSTSDHSHGHGHGHGHTSSTAAPKAMAMCPPGGCGPGGCPPGGCDTTFSGQEETKKRTEMTASDSVKANISSVYGAVAEGGGTLFGTGAHGKAEPAGGSGCCGGGSGGCGTSADGNAFVNTPTSCCGGATVTAEELSVQMGYTENEIKSVPGGSNMGLGCGNPQAIAALKEGMTVVDLGSGGGFDCFLSGKKVGPKGHVIGVDMTPSMLRKARAAAAKAGPSYAHVEFRLGEIEHLPIADNTVDVIISNCVVNLSTAKEKVCRDAFRVLRSGGRIAWSDVVAWKPLPPKLRDDPRLICGCMGGASVIGDLEKMLKDAGFTEVKVEPKLESKEMIRGWAPGTGIEKFCISADITALKA